MKRIIVKKVKMLQWHTGPPDLALMERRRETFWNTRVYIIWFLVFSRKRPSGGYQDSPVAIKSIKEWIAILVVLVKWGGRYGINYNCTYLVDFSILNPPNEELLKSNFDTFFAKLWQKLIEFRSTVCVFFCHALSRIFPFHKKI